MNKAFRQSLNTVVTFFLFVATWALTTPLTFNADGVPVLLGGVGVTIGAVAAFGWPSLIGVFLAAFVCEFFLVVGADLSRGLIVATLYTSVGAIAQPILARLDFDPLFERVRDIGYLFLASAIAPLALAMGLPIIYRMHGDIPAEAFWSSLPATWLAAFLGGALLAPSISVWKRPPKTSTVFRLEMLALFTGLLALCTYTFGSDFSGIDGHLRLSFLVFPFIVWAALRFGIHGSSLSTVFIAIISVIGTYNGLGLFAGIDTSSTLFLLQSYLVIIGLTSLLLGCSSSEHVATELALREVNRRLRDAVKESRELAAAAERANHAKGKFLSMMSHELRTPLNGVIGFTNLLLDTSLTKQQGEHVQMIRSSGESLLTLIDEILDFNRIVSGKLDLKLKRFSTRRTINEVISFFQIKAANKNVELRATIDDNLPDHVVGDSNRLRQVLTNVIGNAIKFTEKGSVVLTVNIDESSENSVRLRFRCADTGIGIKPEETSNLFDAFVQANEEISAVYGGSGLGLAISKNLVEAMAGSIWLESRFEKGTVVYFTARFLKAEENEKTRYADDEPERTELSDFHNHSSGNPLDILVAEDNKVNQRVIKQILAKMGYESDLASDGEEVIAALAQKTYDVILMDVQMPKVDGLEATRRIRNGEHGINSPEIPIVAVTAFALRDDREQCLQAGMDYHLTKPVKLANLASLFHDLSAGRKNLHQADVADDSA